MLILDKAQQWLTELEIGNKRASGEIIHVSRDDIANFAGSDEEAAKKEILDGLKDSLDNPRFHWAGQDDDSFYLSSF